MSLIKSNINQPLISIITACLNRVEYISEAIESVLAQDYPNVEHVIVDGGSTDGTLAIIARYPHLKVISEPDKGVYDAWNKGIQIARGEIIGLLNSDDYYSPNIFGKVMNAVHANSCEIVTGGARLFNQVGKTIEIIPAVSQNEILSRVTFGVPIINAWFFSRSVFTRHGLFNLDYPIISDRDFLFRIGLAGVKISVLNDVVYNYRFHPFSMTINDDRINRIDRALEGLCVAEKYYNNYQDIEIRKFARKWYIRLVGVILKTSIMINDYHYAIAALKRMVQKNPLWIFELLIMSGYLVLKPQKRGAQ